MLTRPRLQTWMDKHKVKLTADAIGEILALASIPTDTRQRICRATGCRNQPCKVCFDHCTHREA
jgi:hypothetical protein